MVLCIFRVDKTLRIISKRLTGCSIFFLSLKNNNNFWYHLHDFCDSRFLQFDCSKSPLKDIAACLLNRFGLTCI